MPEWTEYCCKVPRKKSSPLPANCLPFSEIHHITHLSEAKRILEDGVIKGSPIREGSRLCRSRTPVSWLSANSWSRGSVYGTVRFTYDWNTILANRKVYWVESVDWYRWPAFRFLLTENDPPKNKRIKFYDPQENKGPVRSKRGSWYCRSDRTSHFIDFVDHVDCKCLSYGDSCSEKGRLSQQTSPRMMAYILGRGIHSVDNFLGPEKARTLGDFGIRGLIGELKEGDWKFKGTVSNRNRSEALLRGALSLYEAEFDEEAKVVLSQLSNDKVFHKALRKLVGKHFDLPKYRIRR